MRMPTANKTDLSSARCPGQFRWSLLLVCGLLLASGCIDSGDETGEPASSKSDALIPEDEESFGEPDTAGPAAAGENEPALEPNGAKSTTGDATNAGLFGPVFSWPLIPIHVALMPDGRVLGYGTDAKGAHPTTLSYVVWDPSKGLGEDAFVSLPNGTGSNLFCAAQLVLPASGKVIIVGGARTDASGKPLFGSSNTNLFDPASKQLSAEPGAEMSYRRWYPTLLTTAEGQQLVLGGRDDKDRPATNEEPATEGSYAAIPELLVPGQGWRPLTGAASTAAYGDKRSFSYPRAWQAPNGKVLVLTNEGRFFYLDVHGQGAITDVTLPKSAAPASQRALPSAMYAPGKILALRNGGNAITVDLNGAAPSWQPTAAPAGLRLHSSATVLADGRVWVNGGGEEPNSLDLAAYASETWNPATGQWTPAAVAARARLYHSVSLLLPDGTVLTGGGGTPGPQTNLNGEIYYPPYLFRPDGSGEKAPRPQITRSPQQQLGWNEAFDIRVATGNQISRVTLLRSGSDTHSFNNEQRFLEMPFKQKGLVVHLSTPAQRNLAPPGYYLLFVFDAQGVPSVARILRLA